ncbi:hypothetical protein HGRIS_011114 [Hohenbuehelia grisea]|uniref:Short-chain dehydrogenase/reductase SDR n=1 Tax=Hohenbuehelia grisea TaxID=104357 RepID=A0ABR3IZ05_9AGAR
MASLRPLAVIAGVGNGSGTGAAAARLFSKNGYSIALIGRSHGGDSLKKFADELNSSGGNAAPFTIQAYSPDTIKSTFAAIREHFPPSSSALTVAIYNTAFGAWKSFLDVTPEDVQESVNVNITSAFAFSREAILAFKQNEISKDTGKRGTLIFTGATASIRGNVTTSVFSAGKHAKRALSQSLAKEFGKDNIHVAHAIIDGGIITDRTRGYRKDPEWEKDLDRRLDPESIAASYLYLANQDRTAWTWELDLRPAHEKW